MNKLASVAAAIVAIALGAGATPADAGTFYAPAGPTGPATGTLTFQTYWTGPVTCSFTSGWFMQNNAPRLTSPTLSGSQCSSLSLGSTGFLAPNPAPGSLNVILLLFWSEAGGPACSTSSYVGTFNNGTSTATLLPNGPNCSLTGSLTFPGLTLLP